MTREQVLVGYQINSKKVIAEMLYDTITKYEKQLKQIKLDFDILTVDHKCLKEKIKDECDLIRNNKEHFYFLKQNEKNFIANRLEEKFDIKKQ